MHLLDKHSNRVALPKSICTGLFSKSAGVLPGKGFTQEEKKKNLNINK